MAADKREVEHFSSLAEAWWDMEGSFAPLHRLNPLRLAYIRQKMDAHFGLKGDDAPFSGLKILDLGCGGGLLSEPMARLGAEIWGLDASARTIEVAKRHAEEEGLKIDYRVGEVESLSSLETPPRFDAILCMELLEHVPDIRAFLTHAARLLAPSSLLFLSTINRTLPSFLLAIVGLEYVLRWLPRGTHRFEKFVTPDEIRSALRTSDLMERDLQGTIYDPLRSSFRLSRDRSVNYMMLWEKEGKAKGASRSDGRRAPE